MRLRHPILISTIGVLLAMAVLLLWPEGPAMIPGRRGVWIERLANVALFVPIGLLASLVVGRWWAGFIVGIVISGGVEVAQKLFLDDRVASWWDIAMNGAGAAVGALASAWIIARRRRAHAPGAGTRSGAT
jgi:glycopeptide antibiotics resistance protein